MYPIKHKFYKKQIWFISYYNKQQYWHSHDRRNKTVSIFSTGQFHIHGFSEPYRFDKNGNGGGIFLYILEDIPSKLILTKMTIEGFFVKINLRKKGGSFTAHITQKNLWCQNIWMRLAKILIYYYLNTIILCW